MLRTHAGQCHLYRAAATFTAEIYLDGVFVNHSTASPGGGFVNDFISNVSPGAHVVRVLYRGAEGQITRFGPLVNIN
jgi:hypothetical protein